MAGAGSQSGGQVEGLVRIDAAEVSSQEAASENGEMTGAGGGCHTAVDTAELHGWKRPAGRGEMADVASPHRRRYGGQGRHDGIGSGMARDERTLSARWTQGHGGNRLVEVAHIILEMF